MKMGTMRIAHLVAFSGPGSPAMAGEDSIQTMTQWGGRNKETQREFKKEGDNNSKKKRKGNIRSNDAKMYGRRWGNLGVQSFASLEWRSSGNAASTEYPSLSLSPPRTPSPPGAKRETRRWVPRFPPHLKKKKNLGGSWTRQRFTHCNVSPSRWERIQCDRITHPYPTGVHCQQYLHTLHFYLPKSPSVIAALFFLSLLTCLFYFFSILQLFFTFMLCLLLSLSLRRTSVIQGAICALSRRHHPSSGCFTPYRPTTAA